MSHDQGLEIDGILCVTFGDDSEDHIVVKVHEKITSAVLTADGDASSYTDPNVESCPALKDCLSQHNNSSKTATKRAVLEHDDEEEISARKLRRVKLHSTADETTVDCERHDSAVPCCSLSPVRTRPTPNTEPRTVNCARQNRGGDVLLLKEPADILSPSDSTLDCTSDKNEDSISKTISDCCLTGTYSREPTSTGNVSVNAPASSREDQTSRIEVKREVISDNDGDFSVCLNDEFNLSISSPSGQFNSASDPNLQEMVCEFCQLLVKDYMSLKKHCSTVHGAYTCPTCYRSFLQLTQYETHLETHHKELHTNGTSDDRHQTRCPKQGSSIVRKKCGICGKIFQTSANMLQHLSSAHEFDSVFSCSPCSEYFPSRPTFVIHRKLAHADVEQCHCNTCGVSFMSVEFQHHKLECSYNTQIAFYGATHSSVDCYDRSQSVPHLNEQNSQCNRTDPGIQNDIVKIEPDFRGQDNQQNLTDDAARDRMKNLEENYMMDVSLHDTVKSEYIEDGTMSSCDGSAVTTAHGTNVDDSVSEAISNDPLTGLPIKVFRSRIQENMSVPARHCQESFCCQNCFEVFMHFEAYESHCRVRHRRFVCPYCSTSFANRRNQQRHARKHTGEQPYSCPHCSCKFYRDDDLRRHKLKHL